MVAMGEVYPRPRSREVTGSATEGFPTLRAENLTLRA
jgi:hypothetical protein